MFAHLAVAGLILPERSGVGRPSHSAGMRAKGTVGSFYTSTKRLAVEQFKVNG